MNVLQSAASRSKALLLLAFLIPQSAQAARSNAAVRAFNDGVQHFNAKEFKDAIPHFDDAISSDSGFAEAYFARAACKYYLKSMDGALVDLNDALRIKPDYTQARSLRGAVNYEADRWDNAMDDFNAVLKEEPHDGQALLGRAVILLKRNNLPGAARDFKGFLRARPDDPLAPRVKQLLASLKGVPGEPAFEGEKSAPAADAETPSPYHEARAPSMERLNHLADSLLSSPMADSYSRQVIRGERVEAVGDIHHHPGVPEGDKDSDSDVEIVEP